MTSAWSQLEQMLTCPICLDKFKNPRLLPCQHSFCGDACMDGLVDYARRQIKCPECRAEHRIPYQGVQSLPLNVTLIRFLELHARITGEEPEPVPTFMEKCSICGEKVEGVQRCSHCEKKVCPECKEAHIDLLRREIGRINGQSKRSLNKMLDFKTTLKRSEEKLSVNHATVRHEIEESCRRLMSDLKIKQDKLLEEVDHYVEQEQKTIDKLKLAIGDEHNIISKNLDIAEQKFIPTSDSVSGCKLSWQDNELSEVKEIYNKSMEFVRLFDPEIGDFTRKIRFTLIPEFDTLRKRICELGELKFSETAAHLIANSFQYCNASGQIAQELVQQAAQQQQQNVDKQQGAGYGLAHSNSNTNMNQFGQQLGGGGGGGSGTGNTGGVSLELPNALMRSQSDHRLASQFQQRLKAQEMAAKNNRDGGNSGSSGRYGARNDYESDLRSRYAPPRGTKDYSSDLLREWPRPSDADGSDFGSSIHFKSAFMRRKEKERYGGYGINDDDDDLNSEASYATSARNVRFYDQQQQQQQHQHQGQDSLGPFGQAAKLVRQFETSEVEKAPLSGVPKIDDSPHYHNRLQQMGARSKVERREAEEQGARDKDLVESARQAMSKVAAKAMQLRQASEDEVEKQKQANKMQEQQRYQVADSLDTIGAQHQQQRPSGTETSTTAREDGTVSASTTGEQTSTSGAGSLSSPSLGTPSSASLPGGRRSLYGQAVTERSKRQLTGAIQEAASYASRRRSTVAQESNEQQQSPTPGVSSNEQNEQQTQTSQPPSSRRRALRSSSRSLSKQSSSIDRQQSSESGTGSSSATSMARRTRRTLARADSSQSSQQQQDDDNSNNNNDESESKNLQGGSGGLSLASKGRDSPIAGRQQQQSNATGRSRSAVGQPIVGRTPTTTDDEAEEDRDEGSRSATYDTGTVRRRATTSRQSTTTSSTPTTSVPSTPRRLVSSTSKSQSLRTDDGDEAEDDDDDDDELGDDEDERAGANAANTDDADEDDSVPGQARGARNQGNRRSRELLPSSVNRLLDRSAQIRRDSQEQRSRGDSPQRHAQNARAEYASSPSSSSVTYYSSSGTRTGSGSSSSPAMRNQPARYGYRSQRSIGSPKRQGSPGGGGGYEAESSNNSIYTTASSGHMTSSRRSSTEDSNEQLSGSDQQRRQSAGSSSERTVVETTTTPRYRRDTDNDSTAASSSSAGYQSRFLARSRTSAALSSASSAPRSHDEYQYSRQRNNDHDDNNNNHSDSPASSTRSYLSSRDRFMQSASVMSPSSSATTSTRDRNTGATSGSSTSAVAAGNHHQHRPPPATAQYKAQVSQYSRLSHNSPFMGADDDDDDDDEDDFGAFMTQSGYKTHSDYLRNKFERSWRQTSGNSTSSGGSSSYLARSKSSHAFAGLVSSSSPPPAPDSDGDDHMADIEDQSSLRRTSNSSGTSYAGPSATYTSGRRLSGAGNSRRGSLAGSLIRESESETTINSPYSHKGKMLFKLGTRGSDAGNFTWPRGVAVGYGQMGRREIIVADSSNHRVQIFDSNGRFLNEFGSYGSASSEFDCLAGVAINRYAKNYVVSDRYNHRIQIFDMAGKFVRSFGEFGREHAKFNLPWGVACDSRTGTVYVCDKENHRIQVFDSDGTYLNRFGTSGTQAGQLHHPHYIAVGLGRVVVTDTNNHRVQVFDLNGRLIKTIGREGSARGEFKFPRGVAMDETGYIIVGDSGNNRLQIFNPEGCFIKSIGTWGNAEGEFKGIEGVAVDSVSNNILVCDRENHRIQIF